MKRLSFLLILLAFSIISFSQNSVPLNGSSTSEIKRWDLDRYIWSHTHYKNRESDKPVIDFDAIDNWQSIGPASITPDGKYFAYTIDKGTGSNKRLDSLIVQSIENSWRKVFAGATPGFFSIDSKQYIFLDKGTLYFTSLGEDQIKKINGTMSYKVPGDNKNEWLVYQKNDHDTTLILQDLKNKKEKHFTGEYSYEYDKSVTWLVLQKKNTKGLELYNLKNGVDLKFSSVVSYQIGAQGKSLIVKDDKEELLFTELNPVKPTVIWSPTNIKQRINEFKQDASGSQVVFTIEDEHNTISIWYWKYGMEKAVEKVNSNTKGINGMVLQPSASFTDNGLYILFSLKPMAFQQKPMEDAVQLDIYSSKDPVFQANQFQLKEILYTSVFNPENDSVIVLENNYEVLCQLKGDFAIVNKKGNKLYGDRFWEQDYNKDSNWVVSLKDGTRRLIPALNDGRMGWFSPQGKYWVYYDLLNNCHYFSYNLQTGEVKDISGNVPPGKLGFRNIYVRTDKKNSSARPACWLIEDKGLLVYDNYDIWKLDLTGKSPAINLTNGYGYKNNIQFGILDQHRGLIGFPVKEGETFLLTAFNLENKNNGFYRMMVSNAKDPELVFMGPCFMQSPGGLFGGVMGKGKRTLKASTANVWIIQKETANEAPNYYLTKNFKDYKKISYLEPQKKYNWLSTELITFQQLDSTLSQAVLFKPENFDSTRKYPVIVSFYSALSDRLYQYLSPEYLDRPNIFDSPAWLVSHGYLVVTPDIYFTEGSWGTSTVNTIEGIVNFLKKLPYIDTNHIGATGHSNSGRFGYYLLTHSTSFSAMAIGAGASNMISVALSRYESGESYLNWAELNSVGTGLGTLWDNKASWLDHTSVLQADNIKTPLLIFHNKNDGAFLPGGALDMFTALRRLEKPVWWLQYDEGGHTLYKLRDQRDFTIRYIQFFDHYLKGSPAPSWMVQGIPYNLKGIESGYNLKKQ